MSKINEQMEIEVGINDKVKYLLELLKEQKFSFVLNNLLELERVNNNDLDNLIESSILKQINEHFIILVESNIGKEYTSQQLDDITNLLVIIERIVQINDKRLEMMLIKSNIYELLCKLLSITQIQLILFSTISLLAHFIPQIFTNQFLLLLQRSIIPKCSNPTLRLEYFLTIFYHLKESKSYQFDCYFYINFLKINFQNTKLNRQSIIIILETLEHLIRFEENTDESTSQKVSELLIDCIYPKLYLEYNICNRISNTSDQYDSQIQYQFFSLLHLLIIYNNKITLSFISQNLSEIKNILFHSKRNKVPQINIILVLELVNQSLSSIGQESLQAIDILLNWDEFENIIDQLTYQNKEYNKQSLEFVNQLKIKQLISDMLFNMLNKDQDYIMDYFINQCLIGQLIDLTTYLDSKRRQYGIISLVKILQYIKKQPQSKFITTDENNNNEESKNQEEQQQFSSLKNNKLDLSCLSDLFEVASLPYDTNKIIPSYYLDMQQLSKNVKRKLFKLFGDKLPKSLGDIVDEYKSNSKTKIIDEMNQNEWEDIDEEEEDHDQYINQLNIDSSIDFIYNAFNNLTKQM